MGGAAFVAAQWTYDAYGSVFSADHLTPHPFIHAGHKGLFFDRLDVGVADAVPGSGGGVGASQSPRLVPFAHALIHNRNRAYNPQFGRFMQADPNASGMVVIEQVAFHGAALAAASPGFNLDERHTDGANYYQYLSSSPLTRLDPLGLFGFDMAMGYVEVGMTVGSLARDLIETYAANQESDALWSEDWDLPDDFHTRGDASWISDIYQSHDINSFVDDFANPLAGFEMAGMKGTYQKGSRILRGARRLGDVGHHAFFRMLTTWRKNTKEILVSLPPGVQKDYHLFVDRRIREKFKDAPSIWDPKGSKRWGPFMGGSGNKERYFRELISATAAFEKKLKTEGRGSYPLTAALREALGQ